MRILGLDWGTVRVGAAMSDEDSKLAFPLQDPLPAKTAVDDVKRLVDEYGIGSIVLGRPVALSGNETESTAGAERFAEALRRKTGLPLDLVDERLSSISSGKALREQGASERDQREIKDNVAAALMLQQYLDSRNKNGP